MQTASCFEAWNGAAFHMRVWKLGFAGAGLDAGF